MQTHSLTVIKNVADFFDNEAPSYERVLGSNAGVRYVNNVEKRIFRSWVRRFQGNQVVDVGVGTGRLAKILLEMGFSVTGVDRSRAMIERLKRGVLVDRLEVVVGDGQYIPLKANSVQNISCMRVFKYFEDGNRALSEFRRIMMDEGLAIIQVANKGSYQYLLKLFRCLGNRAYNSYLRLQTYGEMVQMFRNNGFEVLDSGINVRIPFFIYARSGCYWWVNRLQMFEKVLSMMLPGHFMGRDYLFLVQKCGDVNS